MCFLLFFLKNALFQRKNWGEKPFFKKKKVRERNLWYKSEECDTIFTKSLHKYQKGDKKRKFLVF